MLLLETVSEELTLALLFLPENLPMEPNRKSGLKQLSLLQNLFLSFSFCFPIFLKFLLPFDSSPTFPSLSYH